MRSVPCNLGECDVFVSVSVLVAISKLIFLIKHRTWLVQHLGHVAHSISPCRSPPLPVLLTPRSPHTTRALPDLHNFFSTRGVTPNTALAPSTRYWPSGRRILRHARDANRSSGSTRRASTKIISTLPSRGGHTWASLPPPLYLSIPPFRFIRFIRSIPSSQAYSTIPSALSRVQPPDLPGRLQQGMYGIHAIGDTNLPARVTTTPTGSAAPGRGRADLHHPSLVRDGNFVSDHRTRLVVLVRAPLFTLPGYTDLTARI